MLVIFDVEGVLFDAEYLPLLAEELGREREIWDITRKGIQGLIDWEEGLRTRVEALRGIDYGTCRRVADALPIMTGAREACGALKAAGFRTMAVSGGFTIMTDRLRDELGLDHIFSNELLFRDGRLDGVRVDVGADKARPAMSKIAEWGQRREEIAVVVDGANDLKLFDICGLGIAFRAQDRVKDMADEILDEKDLSLILGIIGRRFGVRLRPAGAA